MITRYVRYKGRTWLLEGNSAGDIVHLIDVTDTSKGVSAKTDDIRFVFGEMLDACLKEWNLVDEKLSDTHIAVLRVVQEIGDPLLRHIRARVADCDDYVQDLVCRGMLRMKDDDIDHDWAYELTNAGKQALAACEKEKDNGL